MIETDHQKIKKVQIMSTELAFELLTAQEKNSEEFQKIDQWLAEAEEQDQQLLQI